jgi:hypothetical protein
VLVERLHEQQQNNEIEEEDDGKDADIEDVELDPEMQQFDDEDEDVDSEENLANVENLRRPQKKEYVDLEDQYDDEKDENQIFTSEIDNVDEMIWLSDTLDRVMSQPAGTGTCDIVCTIHNPSSVQNLIQMAHQRRVRKAEKQAL